MALGSAVHKEADMMREPRLDASQSESLQSPLNDFGSGGFLDEVIEQETMSDAKKRDSVKSKVSSARDRHGSGSLSSSNTDAVKRDGSKSAFGSMDSQIAINTGKEMKSLQPQKSIAAKKPSGQDVQSKSSKRRSKKKGKDDLNEILRKRLDKLEAKLKMIGAQHSIHIASDSAEDVSDENGMDSGRRISSLTSRAEKKRKNNAGDGKFAKRRRIVDDDPERIIAANVNGTATNSSDAKMDDCVSTVLKNETSPGEGVSAMSANFSDEITSMINSQCWEHSENDYGNFFLSSASEQLADTETIMYNVLSQNLQEAHLSGASDTDVDDTHNAIGILPPVVDTDAFTLPFESVEPKIEGQENVCDMEDHKDSKHLGCLSVDTQWDSQFVESFVVKSTHLNSVRDWRSQKLLDLLISGRLKEIPSGTLLELQHEGTDMLVASSLQDILDNLSWLWSVAMGDNMLSSVQDVVSSNASNIDSLTIDFVENLGCVDNPVSMSLSIDQLNDDVIGKEITAKQEVDWLCEESQLIESLSTSLDTARQKVLHQSDKCSVTDVAEASAASFGSLLEHAMNSSETTDPDVPGDLYSPTRPTEVDHALAGAVTLSSSVDRPKELLHTEQKNEVQLLQSADVTVALNDLVEKSAPTRRTIRVHKKEDVTVMSPSDRITGSGHKSEHGTSSSRVKGDENLEIVSSQMSYSGLVSDKPVMVKSNLSVSEELPVNWSADLSNIAEIEVATDSFPSKQSFAGKQMQDIQSADGHIAVITGEFDSSVENQRRMNSLTSPVASRKSSKKRSHEQESDKLVSYHGGAKKESRSGKRKDNYADVTTKKNKKKPQDIGKSVDRRLKLDVISELKHVQKGIEFLLFEKYGITRDNTSSICLDVSLHIDDKHFPDLSGLSFDARIALMSGENKTDNILKAVCSTALLNDLFTELNIQLSTFNLSLPKNSSVHLTDRPLGEKLSDANISHLRSPSSPPSMRRRTARPSSVSRRNKSNEERGVNVIPSRHQEPPVTESEKRLMKADKLMQTFRRSQIAKRQNQKSSPKPPASFIRQVQTVTSSEGLARSDTVDDEMVLLSSEVIEPDFSTVITDGSMLASVELPHIPPKSLPPLNDDDGTQLLPLQLPGTHPAEAVPVSTSPQHPDSCPAEAMPITTVPHLPDRHPVEPMPMSTSHQLPDLHPSEAVPMNITPAPPCESTVSNSAQSRVSSGGKERRVYVFNSGKAVCQEVQVSSECLFLNYKS